MGCKGIPLQNHFTSEQLEDYAKKEKHSKVSQRILAIRFLSLGHTIPQAAKIFPIGESQLRNLVHRYNKSGISGLYNRPGSGRKQELPKEREEEFKKIILDGPKPEEEISAYRGEEIQKILLEKFNVKYALSSVYNLLHRLGLSNQTPRPYHPKTDFKAQEEFKKKFTPR